MQNVTEIIEETKKIHKKTLIHQITSYILSFCQEADENQFVTYFFDDRIVAFTCSDMHKNSFSIHFSDLICHDFVQKDIDGFLSIKSYKGLMDYVECFFNEYNKDIYL